MALYAASGVKSRPSASADTARHNTTQQTRAKAARRASCRVCDLHFHVRAALVAELDFLALGKFAHIAAKDEQRAVRAPDVGGCPLHHLGVA